MPQGGSLFAKERIAEKTGAFSITTEHKKQTRMECTPLIHVSENRGLILVKIS